MTVTAARDNTRKIRELLDAADGGHADHAIRDRQAPAQHSYQCFVLMPKVQS